MGTSGYTWRIKHKLGDNNQFSEYFQAHNFNWRLVAISTDRHYIFLEHFGYLTFDVFADYHLCITYTDGKKEEKSTTFSFGSQLDFGVEIKPKETESVFIEIISAVRCYESKKDTPYAGMINLGSTCYLNSLIQTLFHIKEFVQEIFKQEPKGKTFEMQKLFYQLEKEKNYVDTFSFANAFKLDDPIDDQQDIQEFFNVLLDTLEKEAKETPFFKYIEDTFYGKLGTLIECEKGCRSEKVEKYNDIQLIMGMPCVEGMHSSLEDSLQAHITTTILEKSNLYNCEKHGYVRATKKDYFKAFSPVLFFQIKRFNMDYETGEVYKINDYFSFPTSLDLSPFTLSPEKENRYSLYSVNVHLGDGTSEGHYYAYIKKKGGWYKFNDCYVTRSSEKEAVDGTFGGKHLYKNKQNIANAYYLVYVKDTEKERLLGSPSTNEPPALIKNIVEKDKFLAQVVQIAVYTEKTVKGYWGQGPVGRSLCYLREPPISITIELSQSLNQLRTMVKQAVRANNIIAEDILIYTIENNQSILPVQDANIVGDLSSNCLFFIEKDKSIPEEDVFILFVKTEKAIEQPHSLKFAVNIKSVHAVSRKENILRWAEKHHSSQTALLAERNGQIEGIKSGSTFADTFGSKSSFGIIITNAGADSLKEYFAEIAANKVLIGTVNCLPLFSLWIKKEASEEEIKKAVEDKINSDKFTMSLSSDETVELSIDSGYSIVQLLVLNEKTENVNLLQKHPYIIPTSFQGADLLDVLKIPAESLKPKAKLVRTYCGDKALSVFSLTQKVSAENGALLVLQQVSSKNHAEASIRYNNETVGHPFFIDMKKKRTAMEAKRRYRFEQGIVMRISHKRHSIIEDESTLKKVSSSDLFVFEIDYAAFQKIQMQRAYHLF